MATSEADKCFQSMAISIHYVYRGRYDSNLKNSRFIGITKGNEEYLGVLDINVVFSQKISLVSWN